MKLNCFMKRTEIIMKKIGFVIPWYHKDILGGAEMDLRGIVKHLSSSGVQVEILTTCVKEFSADWTVNYFQEGVEDIEGIPVRRFKVRKGNLTEFHKINARLMNGEHITRQDEEIFLNEMVNSPDLYQYIRVHHDEYHRFVFMPYMFGTTYFGVQECLDKAILIPCFHDESYAYFEHFKDVFKNIKGILYNSEPEKELANHIYDLSHVKQKVLGVGVDTEFGYDKNRFREKYQMTDPYILYAGRKDSAKNIDTLITYFTEFKKRNADEYKDLKLVLIGGGEISISGDIKNSIIDLGYVPAQDKFDACAGSLLLCQPSKNESFSIVIMESWLCERPVLVNEMCDVTKNFAVTSKAGLYFKNYFDFEGCIKYISNEQEIAKYMGLNGRKFVLENFKWKVIVDRLMEFFE